MFYSFPTGTILSVLVHAPLQLRFTVGLLRCHPCCWDQGLWCDYMSLGVNEFLYVLLDIECVMVTTEERWSVFDVVSVIVVFCFEMFSYSFRFVIMSGSGLIWVHWNGVLIQLATTKQLMMHTGQAKPASELLMEEESTLYSLILWSR